MGAHLGESGGCPYASLPKLPSTQNADSAPAHALSELDLRRATVGCGSYSGRTCAQA